MGGLRTDFYRYRSGVERTFGLPTMELGAGSSRMANSGVSATAEHGT